MFVAFTLLYACQQDVLLSLGDPTHVKIEKLSSLDAEVMSLNARPSTTALLIRPAVTTPTEPARPVVQTDIATAAAASIEGADALPSAAPPPSGFNPISIPEDAPESTGVRFPGVTRKGTGRPPSTVRMKNGRPVD